MDEDEFLTPASEASVYLRRAVSAVNAAAFTGHFQHALIAALSGTENTCAECAERRSRADEWESTHPNYCHECGRWDGMEDGDG